MHHTTNYIYGSYNFNIWVKILKIDFIFIQKMYEKFLYNEDIIESKILRNLYVTEKFINGYNNYILNNNLPFETIKINNIECIVYPNDKKKYYIVEAWETKLNMKFLFENKFLIKKDNYYSIKILSNFFDILNHNFCSYFTKHNMQEYMTIKILNNNQIYKSINDIKYINNKEDYE